MRRAARSFAFGDGVLVLADDERLVLLDELAEQIWRAMEAGLSPADITKALIDTNPAYSENIRRDVSALLAQWSAEGFFDSVERAATQSPIRSHLSANPVWAAQWRCRLRDVVVDLAVEDPSLAKLLGRLFEHFPTVSENAKAQIKVRGNHDGEATVFVNGREYARTCSGRNVQRALIELVWPNEPLCALVHAGAVAQGHKAACFAGVSGSGKTTLIARLVGQGLTYLSDDLVPVSMSGRILPWPMPMSVKLGSWDVLLDRYPALETAPTFNVKNTQARPLTPETDAWELGPIRTHVLVFPIFSRGSSTKLESVGQFEALRRLVEAGFLLESPITEERVEVALSWLAAMPAYSLAYGDVDDAANHVSRLLEAR